MPKIVSDLRVTIKPTIMKRSKLKNEFNKERNVKNWSNCKQQRNNCLNLSKESKTRHFNNLSVENKHFWKTMKPFFTDKTKNSPVFKKLDNTSKDNYQPISTLCDFAKLFESIIYSQLNDYMQNKFESWNAKLNNGFKGWSNNNGLIEIFW